MAIKENAVLKDVTGRYLTKALFKETAEYDVAQRYPHMCTIKEAHDLYMEIADPTEYEFAKALLYHPDTNFWDHWQKLLKTESFVFYLNKWRIELEVKLRSAAIKVMKNVSESEEKNSAAAAKWLAEKGWKDKRDAGRPTNEEIERERKVQAGIKDDLDKDAERILNS